MQIADDFCCGAFIDKIVASKAHQKSDASSDSQPLPKAVHAPVESKLARESIAAVHGQNFKWTRAGSKR